MPLVTAYPLLFVSIVLGLLLINLIALNGTNPVQTSLTTAISI